MALLDKEQAVLLFESIVHKSPNYCEDTDGEHMPDDLKIIVYDFAQAIYELGVKAERERAASVCEIFTGAVMANMELVCAEAIRKG